MQISPIVQISGEIHHCKVKIRSRNATVSPPILEIQDSEILHQIFSQTTPPIYFWKIAAIPYMYQTACCGTVGFCVWKGQ